MGVGGGPNMSVFSWVVSVITNSGSSFSEILFLSGLVGLFFKANNKTGNYFRVSIVIEKVTCMSVHSFFMIQRKSRELFLYGVVAGA